MTLGMKYNIDTTNITFLCSSSYLSIKLSMDIQYIYMSYSWSNSAGPNLLKLGLENPIFVHGK